LTSVFSLFQTHIEPEHQNQTEVPQNETLSSSQVRLQETQFPLTQSQIGYNELVVEKKIGVGSYGKVCIGKWNGTPVALKFCRKKGKLDEFMQEVRVMMYVCEYEYMRMNVNEFDFRIPHIHTQMKREISI
jgi:hypothetical protein